MKRRGFLASLFALPATAKAMSEAAPVKTAPRVAPSGGIGIRDDAVLVKNLEPMDCSMSCTTSVAFYIQKGAKK